MSETKKDKLDLENIGFFTRLFSSKFRMYLRELKHSHNLEIEGVAANFNREKSHWEEDKQRALNRIVEDHDIKLKEAITLTQLSGQQQAKQAELNFERKLNEATARLNKEYYDNLTEAMSKLHEEGNLTTKFTQELALKMMGSMPSNKSETRVLTGRVDVGVPDVDQGD